MFLIIMVHIDSLNNSIKIPSQAFLHAVQNVTARLWSILQLFIIWVEGESSRMTA